MSKEDFFNATRLSVTSVDIDGFGPVEIRELTTKQLIDLNEFAAGDQDVYRAEAVIAGCDMFDDHDNDLQMLISGKGGALVALYLAVVGLSSSKGAKKKP